MLTVLRMLIFLKACVEVFLLGLRKNKSGLLFTKATLTSSSGVFAERVDADKLNRVRSITLARLENISIWTTNESCKILTP